MTAHFEFLKHKHELLDMWPAKVLRAAEGRRAFVLSVLANVYDAEGIAVLLKLTQGNAVPPIPGYTTTGTIDRRGLVMSRYVGQDGMVRPTVAFFNLLEFQSVLRRIADRAKLSDQEREEFFAVARKWIKADNRQDPNTGRVKEMNGHAHV